MCEVFIRREHTVPTSPKNSFPSGHILRVSGPRSYVRIGQSGSGVRSICERWNRRDCWPREAGILWIEVQAYGTLLIKWDTTMRGALSFSLTKFQVPVLTMILTYRYLRNHERLSMWKVLNAPISKYFKGSVQRKLRPMLLYIIQKLFLRRWATKYLNFCWLKGHFTIYIKPLQRACPSPVTFACKCNNPSANCVRGQ